MSPYDRLQSPLALVTTLSLCDILSPWPHLLTHFAPTRLALLMLLWQAVQGTHHRPFPLTVPLPGIFVLPLINFQSFSSVTSLSWLSHLKWQCTPHASRAHRSTVLSHRQALGKALRKLLCFHVQF